MAKILAFIKKNPGFAVCFLLALLVLGVAVFAPLLATHDPYEAVLADAVQAPGAEHWFGTDRMGRDLYSRVIYGARASLTAAFALVCIVMAVGTLLGILSGYFGGILDVVIMRLSDMMVSFPGMVLAIAVEELWGQISGMQSSPSRGKLDEVCAAGPEPGAENQKQRLYCGGQSDRVENIPYSVEVSAAQCASDDCDHRATDIGSMMLEIAGLSFLGFGAQHRRRNGD